jgi:hypothetical protein
MLHAGLQRASCRQLSLLPDFTHALAVLRLMQATSVPFFSNASITGTNPSPNKRGLHCLSVPLTDRMDAA